MSKLDQHDLLDFEEEHDILEGNGLGADTGASAPPTEGDKKKGSYVGIHATGFRDFLLKPELLRAIVDCGFEHPSEGEFGEVGGSAGKRVLGGGSGSTQPRNPGVFPPECASCVFMNTCCFCIPPH